MKAQKAFTLIELMIAVAIVGILAAIAIPSYQESVRKSRRADAKGALLSFANAMERHFTEVNSYCDAAAVGGGVVANCLTGTEDTGPPLATVYAAPAATTAFYTFTISVATTGTYTLLATRAGAQATDRCGNLSLTNTGVRINSAGLTPAECW
jgi:type IV pilus assembly protein PilE